MSLRTKTVTSDFEDIKALENLNNEAFPKEERMEIREMTQLISKGIIDVTAVYDDDTFVGFYALSVRKPTAYVFFLAIDSSKRSRGYGSRALALMKEQYADYQIVLDMEAIDDKAENLDNLKIRKTPFVLVQMNLNSGNIKQGEGILCP